MPFTLHRFRLLLVLTKTVCLLVLYLPTLVQAETKTIVSEATYSMGDGETPFFAEAMVLLKAKQRALEEAGTYVESYTHVRNLDLTVDEIKTIAGGVMKTEIIEQNRAQEGNGFRFYVKIRALITTDKIEDLARRIKGRNVAEENNKILEDYARINRNLDLLKHQIAESKTEPERELILDKIREVETQFRQVRLTEMTLYKRLLSGEELSAQVSKALLTQQKYEEEEVKRAEWQKHALKDLLETLRNNGFTLLIDPPKVGVNLSEPESITLGFPVTINASDQLKRAIKDLGKAYSGDIPWTAEMEVEKALINLVLSLSVFLKNGSEHTGGPYTLTFKSLRSYDLNFIFRQRTILCPVEIPRQFVEQLASVEGRVSMQ